MKRLVKSISDPKPGRKWNEDLIDSYQNVYWLLDGASTPSGLVMTGNITTLWYVQQLNEGLKLAIEPTPFSPLSEILAQAMATVQTKMQAQTMMAKSKEVMPSSTVVLIRINESEVEYLVLGDSYLLVQNGDTKCITDQRIKTIAPHIRRKIEQALANGEGFHSHQVQRLKKQLVLSEMQARNKNEGYWIASTNKEAAHHALTGRIELSSSRAITLLLMSDGYAQAVTHLHLFASWQDFIYFLQNNGLHQGLQLIREQERADARGQRYIRSSPHDDASALWIRLIHP